MIRIEKLIKEKGSEGIEYRTIESVIELMQPKVKVKSNEYLQCGKYPVIDQGKKFIGGYTNEETPFLKDEYVIFGDHTCVVKYVDFEFVQGADGVKVLKADKTVILPRYLYHCMTAIKIVVDYARHWSKMKVEKIPVPPIEVQQEIVRILDKFIKLEEELRTELDTRKKQYEHYRDKLMAFDGNEVEWKRLDQIFTFIRNGFVGKVTSFFTDEENGIRYLEGTNIHNGVISDNEVLYVTKEFHQKHKKNELKSDDILMVQSGHIGECAMVGEKYKGSNCHALIIMSNGGAVLSKFYVHYFHSFRGFRSLTPAITGGAIKHVLAGKVGNIKVPVPTLEKQREIVDILDKLERYCFDEQDGLLAEIAARHKQYEYYRDKLLTFERKVV